MCGISCYCHSHIYRYTLPTGSRVVDIKHCPWAIELSLESDCAITGGNHQIHDNWVLALLDLKRGCGAIKVATSQQTHQPSAVAHRLTESIELWGAPFLLCCDTWGGIKYKMPSSKCYHMISFQSQLATNSLRMSCTQIQCYSVPEIPMLSLQPYLVSMQTNWCCIKGFQLRGPFEGVYQRQFIFTLWCTL